MNFKRSRFRYTKHQRNGIFFLLLLIVSIQLISHQYDFTKEAAATDNELLAAFARERDSLNEVQLRSEDRKTFRWNPNYLTEGRIYRLGLSYEAFERLSAHRSNGRYINTLTDFKRVTGISDSLAQVVAPLLHFHRPTPKTVKSDPVIEVQDLNQASAEALRKVRGIGMVLSDRIVKYRNLLQGFTYKDQLYEVWNLDRETADRVLEHFEIRTRPEIEKINVNEASFKEILALPYIDYDLTVKIVEFRREVAEIQDIQQLKKIDGFPLEKFDRITLYLWAQ